MTYKDIFRIAIRLFALASILFSLFTLIPQIFYQVQSESSILLIVGLIATLAFISILYYFLIIKSDTIIDVFRLSKGFDKVEVSLNSLTSKNLLEIGIIVIGCSTSVSAFPSLLVECFTWFSIRAKAENNGFLEIFESKTETYVAERFLEVLLGYLIVTNFDKVSAFITPKK